MGNSLRCCLACVLPCGALDLIRIVHLNGCVEEITGPITAGEVLKANPNHVLSKPSSQGMVRRILILSPHTELKRGGIYFLIPESSVPEKSRKKNRVASEKGNGNEKCGVAEDFSSQNVKVTTENKGLEKKKSSRHDRRHSRSSGVWRPHLESISEDL